MGKKDPQLSEELDSKGWKFKKLLKRIFIDIAVLIGIIVVIYILLCPRTCCVKWTNRDVARRNDLSQIETAIENYKDTYWVRPKLDSAMNWMATSSLPKDIMWWQWIPADPNINSEIYWLWDGKRTWEYLYIVTKKDWVENWWFVLMAKTEWEGWSNRVVCKDGTWLGKWYITNDTDLENIVTCETHTKWDSCSANRKACTYTAQEELRYILFH